MDEDDFIGYTLEEDKENYERLREDYEEYGHDSTLSIMDILGLSDNDF